jgi:hypothetical protein
MLIKIKTNNRIIKEIVYHLNLVKIIMRKIMRQMIKLIHIKKLKLNIRVQGKIIL